MNRHSIWTMFLSCALAVPPALPQTATGNIIGHATDPAAAAVPGVEVTATNPATGITTRVTSDEQGIYRILYLAPGTYTVSFQKTGFTTLLRNEIVLRSNDTVTVDVQLQVGTQAERIQVTGETPLLETATSTTGTTLEGKQMNAIPIMQRYTWMAMYLMPGVTSMNGFHIAGARDRGIGYQADGIPATEPVRSGVATNRILSTTQNAIEEVKMVTTVLPADSGHSAGGMMSITYKSGTNKLHAEAEDRYINNALLHRAYFNLLRPTAPFSYHELSGLIHGPVYLPKIYDGRNRTFFLFGWQRHHEKLNQQVFADVPNDAMLNGDFSFNGLGFPIYDPASTRQVDGRWVRDPFAGNIIPRNRIDPVATKFLSFQPWNRPNDLGGASFIDRTGPHQNFGTESKYRSYRTRWDTKIDHVFNEKNRLFGRYSHVRNRAWGNAIALNWTLLDGNRVMLPSDQINSVISDTHVFGPTMILETRVGMNRRKESRTPLGTGENWGQQLGVPGISAETFPSFYNSAGGNFYDASMPRGSYYQVTENFMWQENMTIIRGRHAMKAGYELVRTRANTRAESLPAGVYRFGGTDMPFTPNTGNDFAAFLLGSVVRADFNTALANWLPRWWGHALYFQDDFTVSPRLTLNLGMRWSYESPFNTKYGQHSQFDPTVVDPLSGRLGAITHPGTSLAKRDLNNFQPRVGMAYKLNNRSVFRGGFGITTVDLFTVGLDQNFEEYFTAVSIQAPSGDPRPVFRISQGPGQVTYPVLSNGTSPFVGANFGGRNATWYDPKMRNPYTMNWNATYQYNFASNWLLELSYQGSSGVGLLNAWNINAIPLDISRDRATLDQIFSNQQPYRPYTNFGNLNLWSNFGHSSFHSGTIKAEKRMSKGLTMTSFYTWGRAINDADNDGGASGVTYYNRRLEKARAGYDVRHRSVTYVTYELPVGRGKKWMSKGGVKDYFLGGWRLGWIQTFQSGTPIDFTVAGSPNRYLPGTVRPNMKVPYDDIKVDNWTIGDRFNNNLKNPLWNIQAFAYPDAYTPGAAGRNIIEGPGMTWAQGNLAKTITVKERYNLDLRFDINNIFKTPVFTNPTSSVNITNPGLFGKPTGTVGGWCCLGGSFSGLFVARLWF